MSAIMDLTPYMREYARDFADTGDINWLPYLMYFHPFSYSSSARSPQTRAGFATAKREVGATWRPIWEKCVPFGCSRGARPCSALERLPTGTRSLRD